MIERRSLEQVLRTLDSASSREIAGALWVISNEFHKYSVKRRRDVLAEVERLANRTDNTPEVYGWLVHLANHTGCWVDEDGRALFAKIVAGCLHSNEPWLVKSALESIARSNYLMSPNQVDEVLAYLMWCEDLVKNGTYHEDLLVCFSSLREYLSEGWRHKLESFIEEHFPGTRVASYFSDWSRTLGEGRADVVFYIPQFLSGKSFLQQPTGTLTAATILKGDGYAVKIIDNRIHHLPIKTVISIVGELKPSCVVLISTPYDQVSIYYCDYRWEIIKHDLEAFRKAGVRVVLCGSHGTVKPEYVWELTKVNVIVRGEWERTLEHLVATLSDNGWNWQGLSEVPNIAYHDGERMVLTNTDEHLLYPDVRTLPIPDYGLVEMGKYCGDEYVNNLPYTKFSWGSILAQRGCPYRCSFCYNFFGTKVRRRTPVQVVDEIELLKKDYGVSHIFFIDYTFTTDEKWVAELCNEIGDRNLDVRWNCETRADCLTPNLLHLMHSAHCHRIWLGVETFSEKLLRGCAKEITQQQTLRAIRDIQNAGIKVSCFLMLGLPNESAGSVHYTLKMIRETGIEYTKSIITAIPRFGAEYYRQARPYLDEETFEAIYGVRGLVDNAITEADLTSTIEMMNKRDASAWQL